MATFHPYEVEGYGGLDTEGATTLDRLDLGGRLAGDVLTDILYASPEGEVHPALARMNGSSGARGARPINEAKLLELHRSHGASSSHVAGILGLDPKRVAKEYQTRYYAQQQAVVSDDAYAGARPEREAVRPRGFYYAAARRIIPHVTPCECKTLIAAAQEGQGSAFHRDFFARDDRFFNDGPRILREFYGMANATSLSILLAREGVIAPPPVPPRVLAGREEPCACSVLGPEMVHRIYLFLREDWERAVVSRFAPEDRSMGAVLARFNRRVVEHFAADDALRSVGEAHRERAEAMARGAADAGTWSYEAKPARLPGRGRLTLRTHETGGVSENRRAHAHEVAARFGYRLVDGMLVDPEDEA